MDNSRASAWRDSDETNKSQMASFKVPGRYLQLNQRGRTTDYKELHFLLTGDGHAVLSNISLNRPGSSQNLLPNANRLSQNNRSADGWLVQGTHAGSFLSNQGRELHIVADGHGDNRANRIELDALALNRNQDFEGSFSARWISGTPRLICQTWDHSISGSIRLEIPRNLGSPGKVNSVHQAAPLPQVDDLMHHPAVPRSSDTVRVTARVSSVNPVQQVVIVHRADSGNGGGAWSTKPMYDDGTRGGDGIAGDGIYTGQLTEHRSNGRVVQFYVGVVSQDGGISEVPKLGEKRPALYVVDNPEAGGDLRRVRFVVSQLDLDAISDRDNSSTVYGYRYPRLSNHYFNATFIGNEENVVYNCEIRNSGSPWTRGTNLGRGKFKFPKDRLFRGHEKLSYDNDPTSGRMHHNRITRHMLYLMGHEVNENEYIRFAVNSGSFSIKEEVEPLANHLLDRNFNDGSQGELYRIDDEWWFQDSWDRAQRNADWEFKGTYQSGRYHSEWMKRSREVEDDYSSLINLFDVVTKNRYTEEEINQLVDPDRIMIMSAVRGYIDDWDSFSLNRGKNGYLYRRPGDGKFQFFHWDSDLAFRNSQAAFLNGMPGFREWSRKSYNRRLFRYYLTELMNRYTRNSPRMNAWLVAEENSSTLYRIDSGFYQNWFSSRNRPARTEIGGNLNIAFNISTGGGNTITTNSDQLTLDGSAPTDVFDIVVEGHPEASVEWTTDSRFRISGIRLASNGPSPLRILGVNHEGITVRSDTVTVNRTGNASPIASLKAFPPSWRISFDEILGLDATRSLDPEGNELQYTWSVNPKNNVLLEAGLIGDAAASFEFPGLYRFAVEVQDNVGNTDRAIGEVAVYGREGFSPFNETLLEDFWQVQDTEVRDNFSPESWYSLAEKSGRLTLQVLDGNPQSFLGNVNNSYPSVVRDLPEGDRWAFLSEVGLENRRFGDFMSGILIKSREASADYRYFFGIEDGERLSFKRVTANGGLSFLKSVLQTVDQVSLRVQRNGDDLLFEYMEDDQWQLLHRQPLAVGSRTSKAGLFLSTFEPQSIQSSFDYAILVNPEVISPLKDRLMVSEIHYNPLGEGDLAGGEFEFIELLNVSDQMLDLTGVHFVDGIDYAFGELQLSPGQRVVVAKNPEAFLFRYSQLTGLLAEGGYGGQLNNNGERITLLDSRDAEVFSFRYDDAGEWPSRADGIGSSLVLSDIRGEAKNADSWIASIEFHGSPGDTGEASPFPVVINEVLSHTDIPFEDAVELHNLSGESVSIGGWYLSDDLNDLTKYRIPDGTVIPAGGYHVIYEISFDFTNALTPFSLDSANGEFVHLTAADSNGSLIQFVDGPFIRASENSISFGRHPKGDGSFVPMANLTMGANVSPQDPPEAIFEFRKGKGAPNSLPKVGPIVFNRIMYHPIDGGSEFLELVNPTSQAVSLFDQEHPANTWQVSGGINFTFPENITLQSGEAILLTGLDPTLFKDLESIPNSVRVFGPYTGNLNNAGETIELLKPDTPQGLDTSAPGLVPMLLVETVDYDDNLPWPPEADGNGPALNRINPGRFADDPSNWTTDDIPVDPETDSDSDGMPDSFELAHGFDPQSSVDADLDADGDGLDNLGEFLAGTDPLDSTSGLWISAITVSAEQVVIQALIVAGKTYRIQFTDSIANDQWTVMETIEPQGESGLFEVVDSNVSGIGIRFYRMVLD
ncbi:MAG TPA: hypothetical protein EYG38_12930 [Verrucomicrobia bacterium]|nr:hypothetical protein [Verrucomicrobiota bacterium]